MNDKILIRQQRRHLEREAAQWPARLREVTPTELAEAGVDQHRGKSKILRCWRSRDFMVGLWEEPNGSQRLTMQRSAIDKNGQWVDGLTWDQMQRLKAEAGFGDRWAVECYPADDQVVNVANLRHMYLLDAPPTYGWHK